MWDVTIFVTSPELEWQERWDRYGYIWEKNLLHQKRKFQTKRMHLLCCYLLKWILSPRKLHRYTYKLKSLILKLPCPPIKVRNFSSNFSLLYVYTQNILLIVVWSVLCMYACMYIWTPFLWLRTFLLNHLYYLCLLGLLSTLCHSWFSKPLNVFSQVQHFWVLHVIQGIFLSPRYFFFLSWLFLALLISLFLGHAHWPQLQVVSCPWFSWFPEHSLSSHLPSFLYSEPDSLKTFLLSLGPLPPLIL